MSALIEGSAIGTALCISASLFFFLPRKSGRESMVTCRRLIFSNFRHHLSQKNPSCINHHVPLILLSPCSKICTPQLILGFIGYIFASSLGVHFLPVRHGLVKERQAVTFRLRCQRPGAQGYQISSLIARKMVPRYLYLDLSR